MQAFDKSKQRCSQQQLTVTHIYHALLCYASLLVPKGSFHFPFCGAGTCGPPAGPRLGLTGACIISAFYTQQHQKTSLNADRIKAYSVIQPGCPDALPHLMGKASKVQCSYWA